MSVAASPSLARAKDEARAGARVRRAEAARANPDASVALARHAPRVPAAAIVSSYVPICDEIDPGPLVAALPDACALALPRLEPDGMVFVAHRPGDALGCGAFGLREPLGSKRVAPDLVLVPLLAFDRRGVRLGWGKGHYDRWLAAHPQAFAVGLAYAAQECDVLPAEAHDAPLDAILTERETIVVSDRFARAAP